MTIKQKTNLALNIVNKVLKLLTFLIADNCLFDVRYNCAMNIIHQCKHKNATDNFAQKQYRSKCTELQ